MKSQVSPLQEHFMPVLRYSINVTLDGCCDHRVIPADEELHRHAIENLGQADALLFGRVTYEMMEAAFRPPAGTGARPDWMEPFARTIGAAKRYVVSSTLDRVDWNAELVRGDLGKAVQRLSNSQGEVTGPLCLLGETWFKSRRLSWRWQTSRGLRVPTPWKGSSS
jgi:hypothetical protein